MSKGEPPSPNVCAHEIGQHLKSTVRLHNELAVTCVAREENSAGTSCLRKEVVNGTIVTCSKSWKTTNHNYKQKRKIKTRSV